jgi:hypothetical protein
LEAGSPNSIVLALGKVPSIAKGRRSTCEKGHILNRKPEQDADVRSRVYNNLLSGTHSRRSIFTVPTDLRILHWAPPLKGSTRSSLIT